MSDDRKTAKDVSQKAFPLPANTTMAAVLMYLHDHEFVALVESDNSFAGIITQTGLLALHLPKMSGDMDGLGFLPNTPESFQERFNVVKNDSASKFAFTHSIKGSMPLSDVMQWMCKNRRPLPVVDSENKLIGIITPESILELIEPKA